MRVRFLSFSTIRSLTLKKPGTSKRQSLALITIPRISVPRKASAMPEPKSSRPHWPDALQNFAEDSVVSSPALGPRTSRKIPQLLDLHDASGRPSSSHDRWGIWWQDAFWFSTGPRHPESKKHCGGRARGHRTEKTDEAIILEAPPKRSRTRRLEATRQIINSKYGGDVYQSRILRRQCCTACASTSFGQDEHAENFMDSVTRWRF